MMRVLEEAKKTPQMIRGKVVAGFWRCGFLSPNINDMEERHVNYAVAYTRWYRHDEDLNQLENDMNRLLHVYSSDRMDYDGAILGIETKPYRKD